ncbi:MAG: hypothetical protein E6J90_25580 [Deltaproteobacteria bacterium]|nr:MAG: hypothetical protein E6J91_24785 [Deltaproteobacteria bacterium]TMQ15301.1 MAG: hypothetical protein E6J90_25580 [Deltaproteobacteria bacterium]
MSAAQHVLDQAYSLPRIEALAAEPGVYAERLGEELPSAATLAELEARDAALAGALGRIDPMIVRAMRIRLDHALAADTSIGAPTRSVFAATIVGYAGRLPVLAERARDVAVRGQAGDPDAVAQAVIDAARAVLDLRDGLRAGVLALIRALAEAAVPDADRRARDRQRDDAERRRWSAMRRELDAVTADPDRVAGAAMAARLAAHAAQLDEPEPGTEVTRADLLEID